MRVKQNSVTVETLDDGAPYRLWDADLWECVECGVEIITGFGQRPLAEHWQDAYARSGPAWSRSIRGVVDNRKDCNE
jgi:hypothetical protein